MESSVKVGAWLVAGIATFACAEPQVIEFSSAEPSVVEFSSAESSLVEFASAEAPAVDFAYIPSADVQPDGPTFDFRISRFEIRNDQFVAFLNDAMANLDNERGQFMYFDTDSGDVYIHTASLGMMGTVGSGTLLFGASANPHVSYDEASGAYEVATDGEDHPVTGATWYGAVKFCNWMTIDADLGIGERAYAESTSSDLAGWHPVSVTSAAWTTRDLTDEERDELLTKLGYRLPMGGANPSAYNEWYKAASARQDGTGPIFDSAYGFGRSAITSADANYIDSGDPFEPGTTPVGSYDGTDHGGTFPTTQNDNAFDLYDMSGNVWEWLQDQSPIDSTQRRNRGGSWRSLDSDLRVTLDVSRNAGSDDDSTGFRIVQRVLHDLMVTPTNDLSAAGVWGGPYDDPLSNEMTLQITNVVDTEAAFTVTASRPWVTLQTTEGTVAAGESVDVSVSIDPDCSDVLGVGNHEATVRVLDGEGDTITQRTVLVTVREPLSVTSLTGFDSQMPFGSTPSPRSRNYELSNASDRTISWSASWDETTPEPSGKPWLILDGAVTTGGDILSHDVGSINVRIDATEAVMLAPGVYTAEVTLIDECTGARFTRDVSLTVLEPLSVSPIDEVVSTGVFGGPFDPLEHTFTLANLIGEPVTWSVSICTEEPDSESCTPPAEPSWLSLDEYDGTLLVDGEADIVVSITTTAETLEAREHSLTLRFEQPSTGFLVERVVTLEVTGLKVDPEEDAEFQGPSGGPFAPESFVYRLANTGLVEMSWSTSVEFDPPLSQIGGSSWLDVSPTDGVIVDDTGFDDVTLILTDDATQLSPGSYEATITFDANGAVASRLVTLTIGEEAFSVAMALVPGTHAQPGGPEHDFRIGVYEITSAEFAHFLNNARDNALSGIPGVPDARGDYMYFATDTSDVYINDQQAGDEGTEAEAPAPGVLLFDASAGGTIALTGDRYVVDEGMDEIPVTGVSWYGAAKFCNWMTVVQGMVDPDERIYHEGPTLGDWYSLASADDLISLRGFRLPMDGQAETADTYNEWYKAAAWLNTLETNALYGFGRDTLTDSDANFRDSGDTHEPGPTPVGYYDGVNTLADDTVTIITEDGYDLYDMTGNVSEWIHDVGASPQERAIRGGHFLSIRASERLRTDGRGSVSAESVLAFLGFRIVQVVEPVVLEVRPATIRVSGFLGGDYTPATVNLEIHNTGAQTVDDFSIAINPPWLEIEGIAPSNILPGATVTVPLIVTEEATSAGISPAPSGDFALVHASDVQTDGPDHDYWIGRTELTNAAFATFLNNARTDANLELPDEPGIRSEHMYFDTDSGSVYINDKQTGEEGMAAPSDTLTTLLYDASIGRIRLSQESYTAESGYENHPVVGVSWFGAVKYCNWLTIEHGMPSTLRAYAESPSPNLDGWHPVVVDDATWISDGMSGGARSLLVEDTLGYRLPMDDGATGASLFNEWHKAASRKQEDDAGLAVFGATYGFGRDELRSGSDPLAGTDANYDDSGETESDETTPVRFFSGDTTLHHTPTDCFPPIDPTSTVDTDNGYGLYDATGNVREWTQDFGSSPGDRSTRGGSWRDDATSPTLTTTTRETMPAESADDDLGFRVVRGTGSVVTVTVTEQTTGKSYPAHFIVDLREPLAVDPLVGLTRSGVYGDTFSDVTGTYLVTNRSATEMDWTISVDQDWVNAWESATEETSGTLPGSTPTDVATLSIDVATTAAADALGPGTHTATVTIANVTTGESIDREIELTIDPPISIAPTGGDTGVFTEVWGGTFDDLPVQSVVLTNESTLSLDYTVESNQTWLTLEPAEDLTGTLAPAPSDRTIDVSVNDAASGLPVGDHVAEIRFTFVDHANDELSDSVVQPTTLKVEEPIDVDQTADPWRVGANPNPDATPPRAYVLTNNADVPIEVLAEVDQDWLDVDVGLVEVFPGLPNARSIWVSLNDNVLALVDGEYVATVSFEDTSTGITQCRTVLVSIVEDISVVPFDDFVTAGAAGGPITPPFTVYTLVNVDRDNGGPIEWEATVQPAGADWLLVDGGPWSGGTLADGASTTVVVSVDAQRTANAGLMEGVHEAEVVFRALPDGEPVSRGVSLSLVVPKFAKSESLVVAALAQPNGPDYSFQIATFSTTSAEFVEFLNDAREHPSDERGQYMFFDSATGDVYVNNSKDGESGPDPGSREILMFSPAASGQIELVGGSYYVLTTPSDRSSHPITGVSWYGAVKYCNWMTLDQGLLPGQRCYTEALDLVPEGWHPATITTADWLTRDLNGVERRNLVRNLRGFRLPMDEGYDNSTATTDSADTYNEWFMAAAWNPTLRQNTIYGFGRNVLTGADANFLDSGDPLDNGPTPVGYFDGEMKGGTFFTSPNANAFGVFDMTGNVYEWLQGRFNNHSSSISFRTLRGGSYNEIADSVQLRTAARTFNAPHLPDPQVGFRVVRTPPPPTADADYDGDVDADDFVITSVCLDGPGSDMSPGCTVFDIDSDGDVDLKDIARFQALFTGSE